MQHLLIKNNSLIIKLARNIIEYELNKTIFSIFTKDMHNIEKIIHDHNDH